MILAMLAVCAPEPAPVPGVVVVVLDTLRADLGGADAPAWAENARTYSHAYSAAPWTSSSTATIVSGRYPEGNERIHPSGGVAQCEPAPRDMSTLTEWPGDAWPTHVITEQPVVMHMHTGRWGTRWERQPGSPRLMAEAAAWLAAAPSDPWSLYVHSLGAHSPYDGDQGAEAETFRAERLCGEVSDESAAWARESYREAAQASVDGVQAIIDAVPAGSLVIVTSDHGEALGEDGQWEHGRSLHDAQTRVPLWVLGPGVEAGEDDTPVPATCIAATVRGIGCDLRNGRISGDVVTGMLVDGEWQTRTIGGPT